MARRRKLPEVTTALAAIDPSLKGSAVAYGPPSGGLLDLKEFGSEAVGMLVAKRLDRYYALARQVREVARDAEVVFIEGYSFGSKGRATYDIAEYGIVLRDCLLAITMRRFPEPRVVVEIPPSTLKKFVTGKGTANKDQMLSTVVRTMDPDGLVDTNNKADAVALYYLGCQAIGVRAGGYFDETLAKKKQEAVIEANRLYREALAG